MGGGSRGRGRGRACVAKGEGREGRSEGGINFSVENVLFFLARQ